MTEPTEVKDGTREYDRQEEFRMMCVKHKGGVMEYLYKNGYPVYGKTYEKYKKERQRMLKLRYHRLKKVRDKMQWKLWPKYMNFKPHYNKLVYFLRWCKDKVRTIMRILLVINYYVKFGQVYLYNPINTTGYRYYSGESLVIYIIPEEMTAVQKTRMKKAVEQEEVNGFKIKNKMILTANEDSSWTEMLDWKCIVLNDYNYDIKKKLDVETMFFITYYGQELFKKNFESKCAQLHIPIFGIDVKATIK